ncbi:peptidyl-prolyl cis-trans isomerase SurA [Qipengyuania nanhaisediminis]|uniref:Parvulin-like PPIase n=1 Tax=Qipengyuania nanhaisediminis TaxID=604088 RepID=A0A1I5NSQ8_9SPHN|nr:peptidylprolyl isomerase [Qipengyuania nanhaisediminis]SFP24859.1 peptidyl-prolyl cis-trans isomerase SurA [Qipengyuania nanhaisediminis]
MNATKLSKLCGSAAAVVATLALAVTPASVGAQASVTANNLDLPENLTMLTNPDPNVRRATAVVNGHVITGTDLDQRVALLVEANNSDLASDEMRRVREQVLRNLIDETLQIQAAEAEDIQISNAEVDQTYARIAAQNNRRLEDMQTYLLSIGSSPASLKRQIHGELAWQRLLRQKVAFFVNVSAEEVNELMERLEASKGTEEYRLGEIYLSATPENAAAVEANALKIVEQLRQGGSFVAYARQFSEASTAAVGGDLGWIRLPQLKNAQLEAVAQEMQPGQLVGPIEIPGGFSILYLIEKRQVLTADPRDAILSLKQIQISFDQNATQAANEARLQEFLAGVQSMRGCGSANQIADSIGASVVDNDQLRARALPEQLQQIVLGLGIGEATPPFGDLQDGVRVLMLCGRDDPEVQSGPNFDQLMQQIEDERINRAAQRYLRDLRNDAYIEYN